MISENHDFNYEFFHQKAGKFNNRFGEIPSEDIYFYNHKKANLLSEEQAKELIDELLA